MRARTIWTTVALAALAMGACGDATTTPTVGDPPPPPTTAPTAETSLELVTPEGVLAGAGVLVETTAGHTLEFITDAQGKVTFDVPPTSIRALVAHKNGYTFVAVSGERLTNVIGTYGKAGLYLARVAPPPMAYVQGMATNMVDPGPSFLTVTADLPGSTMYQAQGTSFELQVPANRSFNLIGLEWQPEAPPSQGLAQNFMGWTRYVHDARVGGDIPIVPIISDVNLDFGESLATKTAKGGYYLPEDGMMGLTGYAFMHVRTIESAGALFVGAAKHITVNHYDAPEEIDLIKWTKYFPMGEDWARRPTTQPATVMSDTWTPPATYAPDMFASADITTPIEEAVFPVALDGHIAEYEVEYVANPPGTLMTQYMVTDGQNLAFAIEEGPPVDGNSGLRLPSPPTALVDPPPSIHDAVTWTPTSENVDQFATVVVFNGDGDQVGTMLALTDEQATYCPPLPSTSDEPGLFDGNLRGYLVTCTPSEDIQGWCARGAQVGPFTVVP